MKTVKNMKPKVFILLLIVLTINTIRYGTYLIEGFGSIYNWALFTLNLITLLIIIISKVKEKLIESNSD
ncbi:MAG TPA: hypothetical protein VK094_04510 [Pseudogracilibacillus sp.]|nr:hypothetical protein [Pseudogracilibacillus sp.]